MPLTFTDPEPTRTESRQSVTRSALTALGWGIATALSAGGTAVAAVYLAGTTPFPPVELKERVWEVAALFAVAAALTGAIVGAFVGFCRDFRGNRNLSACVLGVTGTLTGGVGAGGSALLVGAVDGSLPPFVSYSLAWVVAGFLAGIVARTWSRWSSARPSDELAFLDEEEAGPPPLTIEWLLREVKRRWRVNRPLVRVLPVLAVALGSSVGAALAPSLALLAVAALGFAVAWVLYRQEQRLDALERRAR